jgi:hypothetical protein
MLSTSSYTLSHISLTMSIKPSCSSQSNSNLNKDWLPFGDAQPLSKSKGVWSDISLDNAITFASGNFCSHSVDTKILSSFSNVGLGIEFAQMNLLPDISSSRRLSPSITLLKRKGHRYSKLSLLCFSSATLCCPAALAVSRCLSST